jgi:hypothetical protein
MLNDKKLKVVNEIKYRGMLFNDKNDFNKQVLQKFTTVQKSFYSLAKFGMKPHGINPHAKAFLYTNFCISKATYASGLTSLNHDTINKINKTRSGTCLALSSNVVSQRLRGSHNQAALPDQSTYYCQTATS